MLCEKCHKNQASVHITKIINSKKTEMHLCSECAKAEQGMSDFFNPYGILKNIMDIESEFAGGLKSPLREERCKICGQSFEDFEKSGKVGCSSCYDTFRDELIPIIRRIHSSTQHVGEKEAAKQPAAKVQNTEAFEIAKLRAQLKTAIAKEDYEQAATLRDKINELKAQKESVKPGEN